MISEAAVWQKNVMLSFVLVTYIYNVLVFFFWPTPDTLNNDWIIIHINNNLILLQAQIYSRNVLQKHTLLQCLSTDFFNLQVSEYFCLLSSGFHVNWGESCRGSQVTAAALKQKRLLWKEMQLGAAEKRCTEEVENTGSEIKSSYVSLVSFGCWPCGRDGGSKRAHVIGSALFSVTSIFADIRFTTLLFTSTDLRKEVRRYGLCFGHIFIVVCFLSGAASVFCTTGYKMQVFQILPQEGAKVPTLKIVHSSCSDLFLLKQFLLLVVCFSYNWFF